MDQLDPKVKRENRDFRVLLDQEELLVPKARKGAQVIQDFQDQMASQVNKDPRVNLEKMVLMEKREKQAIPAKRVPLAKWACPARLASQGPKVQLVFKAVLAYLVTRVTKVRKVYLALKVPLVIKAFMDHKDHLVFEDLQAQP